MSYFITNITSTPVTGVFSGGKPSGIDNDQGNIRAGGNIAETTKFSSNSLGEGNPITTIVSGVNNFISVTAGLGINRHNSRISLEQQPQSLVFLITLC